MPESPYDPYLGTIYEVAFGQSGMLVHENRWLNQPGDLLDAQNVTFENDQVQKEGAAADYDTTAVAVEAAYGNFTPQLTDSATAAIWLPAAGGTAFGAQVASAQGLATSPWTVGFSTSAATGTLVAVAVGQGVHSNDSPIVTGITDTKGNTYARQQTAPAATGNHAGVELWTSILTTGVTNTDTLTLTFTSASDFRAMCAASFTTPGSATKEAGTTAAATQSLFFSSATNTLIGQSYPALLIGAVHWTNDADIVHWLGGFTQRASAGVAGTAAFISLASKLVAAATTTIITAQIDWKSDQTSTPAGTIATTINGTAVTGSGTTFLADVLPGDEIVAGGETQVVYDVTTNTALQTVGTWTQTQSGVAFKRRAGSRVVSATLAGKIFRDRPNAGGNTGNLDYLTLVSGMTTSRRRGKFVAAGKENSGQPRALFYFNGVDPVKVCSGDATSMHTVAAPPADWGTAVDAGTQPVNGIVHQNALFGFGNLNDPHRIYRSQSTAHEQFTGGDSGQYPIGSSIGERLWGAAEYQGVLFLWKYPRGIFYFDDTDPNYLNWSYHIRSEALGCAPSPHAVLPIDDDVLFCNSDGHFHLLSAVNTLGGARSSDLTRALGLHTWTRDHIDVRGLDQLTSVWDPTTKIAWVGCRSTSALTIDNDLTLRFDFGLKERGGPVRFCYSNLWKPNALSLKRRNFTDRFAILIGETGAATFTDPYHYGYRVLGGLTTPTAVSITTPQDDFRSQDARNRYRRKNYDFLELILSGADVSDPTQALTVTVLVDTLVKQTFLLQGSGRRFMYPLKTGDGYEFQVTIAGNAGSVADVRLLGMLVGYRPGSMDHSRQS